ncbi:MAG: thioesterase domain-containing protein [Luteibacter sp.]
MSNARSPTLIDLNDSASACTVFCVHPVGGGLGAYKHLADRLRGTARIYGLEDPSIYANETFASVAELAELHMDTIAQAHPRGPYLIFGACSAGPIAYEIACHLELRGEKVDRVVMFGAQNDLVAYDPTFKNSYHFLHSYLADSLGLNVAGIGWDILESLDRQSACSVIVDTLITRNKALQDVDAVALRDRVASMLMTQVATRRYRAPRSSLDIDLYMHPVGERSERHDFKSWCDWGNLTDGAIHHIEIERQDGAGSGVLSEPYVDTVVRQLRLTIFHPERMGALRAESSHA